MSNTAQVEPTEDQKQAAQAFCACHEEPHEVTDSGVVLGLEWSPTYTVDDIARLLAEREAKLREDVDANIRLRVAAEERTRLLQGLANTARAEADTLQARLREWRGLVDMHMNDANTLRARVAELEASDAHLRKLLAEERGNVGAHSAQHLADIKAAKDAIAKAENGCEFVRTRDGEVIHALVRIEAFGALGVARARLARYDDAKADAPAVAEERCTRCLEPYSRDNWCAETGHDVPGEALGEPDEDDAKAAEGGEG